MIGLLILSFILFWGGGPNQHGILGFRYWNHPGAANTYLESGNTGRFCALLSTLVLSAFPFTFAPELLVATGGEMESPRRNLPTAARRYFWRLIIFYIGCVLAIGILSPSNDPRLTDGGQGAGSSAFVVGIQNAGIHGLGEYIGVAPMVNLGVIIFLLILPRLRDQRRHHRLRLVFRQLLPLPLQPLPLLAGCYRQRTKLVQSLHKVRNPIPRCGRQLAVHSFGISQRWKQQLRGLQLVRQPHEYFRFH
jgi:amino acid transporter